jgi:hypothetical protein
MFRHHVNVTIAKILFKPVAASAADQANRILISVKFFYQLQQVITGYSIGRVGYKGFECAIIIK